MRLRRPAQAACKKGTRLNPKVKEIKGVVIEEIETPLTRKCRQMEKLIDELAKGRKIEKILRSV